MCVCSIAHPIVDLAMLFQTYTLYQRNRRKLNPSQYLDFVFEKRLLSFDKASFIACHSGMKNEWISEVNIFFFLVRGLRWFFTGIRYYRWRWIYWGWVINPLYFTGEGKKIFKALWEICNKLVDVDWNTFQLVYLHCVVTSVYRIIMEWWVE